MPKFALFFYFSIISNVALTQKNDFCIFSDLVVSDTIIHQTSPWQNNIDLRDDENLCIRTVIHVLGTNNQEKFPDELIEDLLVRINEFLTTKNIDSSLVNEDHHSLIINSRIQFSLAQIDPNGNQTNGISRTDNEVESYAKPNFQDSISFEPVKQDSLGGKSAWDVSKYFNIWIAPMGDTTENFNNGNPKNEYYPLGTSELLGISVPGVVIDDDNLIEGSLGLEYVNILSHEIGHALGLFHPWGWPPNSCEIDDYVIDTPLSTDPGGSCLETHNVSNIMGYRCMQMFTPTQVKFMKNNVINFSPGIILDDEFCDFSSTSNDPNWEEGIFSKIYPNPNNGIFTVDYSQDEFSDLTIDFYDAIGGLLESHFIKNAKSFKKEFNLNKMDSGVVLMVIRFENYVHVKRLIIQS